MTPLISPSMTENASADALSSYIFEEDRSYYRSKIFNSLTGTNPLIAAASPLLALSTAFSDNAVIKSSRLFDNLIHEIKAFENNAKSQAYPSDSILLARYIVCEFLDRTILDKMQRRNNVSPPSLLEFFHQEKNGGEKLFIILEKLSRDAERYIDLLELIYVCLRLGYAGKYAQDADGKEKLEQISAQIFSLIRAERPNLKKELEIMPPETQPPPVSKTPFPLFLIIAFTAALLLTVYSSFSYRLSGRAERLYQQIQTLNSPDEFS